MHKALGEIPNTPADDVPDGADGSGNVELHVVGKKRDYAFKPKQHFELGEALGMMDFELAAKLSGARFVVLQKGLARLEWALGQLFLDVHTDEKHGYTEVSPPLLVRDNVMFGTAQLPKFAEDQFSTARSLDKFERSTKALESFRDRHGIEEIDPSTGRRRSVVSINLENWDEFWNEIRQAPTSERLWLIPTAEVPLTNLVREVNRR